MASDVQPTATQEPVPSTSPGKPAVLIVMGVSGSGKSTIGALLAMRLGWEFEDGDWFHPKANIDKMHSGVALTDEDRGPWLDAIAAWIDKTRLSGSHAAIACSALKKRYRDVLIGDRKDVRLVYLDGDEELIARRIATRHEHFMPRSFCIASSKRSKCREGTKTRSSSRSNRGRAKS